MLIQDGLDFLLSRKLYKNMTKPLQMAIYTHLIKYFL